MSHSKLDESSGEKDDGMKDDKVKLFTAVLNVLNDDQLKGMSRASAGS